MPRTKREPVGSARSPQHRLDLLASRVDNILSACRSGAVINARWWRPSWQAGYQYGLRRAHEAAVEELIANGCEWPTMPSARYEPTAETPNA